MLPGQKTLVVNVVVVGPFEEEEEGTGIASDIVKAQGEDPATQGCLSETGCGGTPAILSSGCSGCVLPWLAREETLGP